MKPVLKEPKQAVIVKRDLTRQYSSFEDLIKVVRAHYYTYENLYNFLAPYNARQRNSNLHYIAPSKEELLANVKNAGMNELSFNDMINSAIKFCMTTKGKKALPTPHPSVIHSIQLPKHAYTISKEDNKYSISIPNCEPVFFESVRNPESFNLVIIKPKMAKLGTVSVSQWEIIFCSEKYYMIEHTDSNINPRYSGKF